MAADKAQSPPSPGAREVDLAASAKWLVAGLGAVGAALLSGVQLGKFGGIIGTDHVVVAVVAGVGATGALVAAVMLTIRVMLPKTVSLGGLRMRESERPNDFLVNHVRENADQLLRRADDSVGALEDDYRAALDNRHQALEAYFEHFEQGTETDAERQLAVDTSGVAARLNVVVDELISAARLEQARHAFRYARSGICVVALVGAASMIALTWAANGSDHPAVDLRGANLAGATLQGVSLKNAVLDGMTIANVNLTGTYMGGASIAGTKWEHVTCPDGVLSDNAGNTCAGHLAP
jgi:uncharacterized protein YjbI with pentapeptide repeats